jgi:anti-anti-sigma factor
LFLILGRGIPLAPPRELAMMAQKWADGIWVAPLSDGPDLADDLKEIAVRARAEDALVGIVLDLSSVSGLSSVCLTHLLQIHKTAVAKEARLTLTALPQRLRPIFRQTGLDRLFDFSRDVSTALAAMQLECGA